MPKLTSRPPAYCRYAPRGTACVRLDGKRHYLPGPYGSPDSREAYARLIAEWASPGPPSPCS